MAKRVVNAIGKLILMAAVIVASGQASAADCGAGGATAGISQPDVDAEGNAMIGGSKHGNGVGVIAISMTVSRVERGIFGQRLECDAYWS